ncbi:hypothetical protein MetMK1DRAFT_00026080 [Metallosphaera yellowstonensis MK1]|jgi:hypothetical protein|uniref:Lipoate--protein ligase n=1 Tax=Metallosphaera yellowstonensis MK1 TaxID=671065 RepID=H2C7Q9_9CREN|nr:hypothetical protein [Metallosphaera yellowstonensis]EHP68185.1 hypothetical protein MetMK1DRAFT_00026080 [Metallosphaera yellowstonensis MK1]
MICERIFRSRAGKTVILRVYIENEIKRVEVTGDFFGEEEEVVEAERDLANLKLPSSRLIGVDPQELLKEVEECLLIGSKRS